MGQSSRIHREHSHLKDMSLAGVAVFFCCGVCGDFPTEAEGL